MGVQPQATYYKAYDLDYPNPIDRFRYDFAARHGLLPAGRPDIGGEIQIHGRGIVSNWTWGCIALRDEDIAELFSHPEIGMGVAVTIAGQELTLEDLASIQAGPADLAAAQKRLRELKLYSGPLDGQSGPATMEALGVFQLRRALPVTCQLDRRTRQLLL